MLKLNFCNFVFRRDFSYSRYCILLQLLLGLRTLYASHVMKGVLPVQCAEIEEMLVIT